MTFDADDLHPMRFLRQFPEAREIVRREVNHCHNGLLTSDAFQRVADAGMTAYNRALDKLPFEKRPTTTDVAAGTISTVAHLVAFAAGGRNSFWLPAELVSLLRRTDLGDIRLSDMHLPFRCFYLGFAGGLDVGLPGEPNVIDGAYVESFARGPDNDTAPSLSFYITSRRTDGPHRGSGAWILGHEPHFFAPLTLASLDDTLQKALDQAVATNDIGLRPDLDALASLREGVEDARKDGLPVGSPTLSGYERAALFNQAAYPTASGVLALLCNALCLLSSDLALGTPEWPKQAPPSLVDAVVNASTPKRRRTAAGRLAEDGYFSIRRLDFHLGAVEHRAYDAIDPHLPGREVAAHWRRGHWRRQAHGPGLSERRLIWIRPVLVRQDRGEPAIGHLYAVTEQGR
ncbi:MAG: hypothetical protein H5U22_23535 [Rhizobium sp.]|jgi:hypothetical protein|nr:hypothetical protein [Rhizobium sp.]